MMHTFANVSMFCFAEFFGLRINVLTAVIWEYWYQCQVSADFPLGCFIASFLTRPSVTNSVPTYGHDTLLYFLHLKYSTLAFICQCLWFSDDVPQEVMFDFCLNLCSVVKSLSLLKHTNATHVAGSLLFQGMCVCGCLNIVYVWTAAMVTHYVYRVLSLW